MKTYLNFLAMIAVSTAAMFAVMYLGTNQVDHVFFSQMQAYMSLLMGSSMAVIMLLFMHHMYPNRRWNMAIVAGSVAVFALALWLTRSQQIIGDVAYMKDMIPHHSMAILTSENAHLSDPRVRKLANGILETQRREIDEMKSLISDLQHRK